MSELRTPVSLDIVVCTYNNASLLDRALAAIAAQEVGDDVTWSVVVVDNNCTDGTADVVARHAARLGERLRLVREPRQGLTPARLRGVSSTAADWIAFVDDDCLLAPDWIAEAAACAREHPACGAFGGFIELEWEREPDAYVHRWEWAYAAQDLGREARAVEWVTGMVVRREALAAIGWIDRQLLADRTGTALVSGGDVEIGLRLGTQFELWYTPRCRLRHVVQVHRTTHSYLARLVYGLGVSSFLGDTMQWQGSERIWVPAAALRSHRPVRAVLEAAAGVVRGRRDPRDVTIAFSFLCGWWGGILRFLTVAEGRRAELVGLAARPRRP